MVAPSTATNGSSSDRSDHKGEKFVALCTGATGISSIHLVRRLLKDDRFGKVYGVSRRDLYDLPVAHVEHVKLDLLDAQKVKDELKSKDIKDVTHLYQNAFVFSGDDVKDIEINFGMHKNIIEGLEAAGSNLQHVYFNSGGKWYGQAVGPIKTPCHESDPRHMPPNFYYNMQDYCEERRAQGAKWTWSSLRPNPVAGVSRGSYMNITTSVALYAVICKELNLPLRFPGSDFTWNAVNDVTDVDLLSDATVHLSTHKACENQAYNINNGDLFRWKELWPKIAHHFGMETGPNLHIELVSMMGTPDKKQLWDKIVKKYGLISAGWDELATWPFADFVFNQPSDWFQNCNKLKQAGFHGMLVDTDKMYIRLFKEMAEKKMIPDYAAQAKPLGGPVKVEGKGTPAMPGAESASIE
ncbi:TPA: hypothetical protein ACH3X3_006818 [Trebouxia sp. C0006]